MVSIAQFDVLSVIRPRRDSVRRLFIEKQQVDSPLPLNFDDVEEEEEELDMLEDESLKLLHSRSIRLFPPVISFKFQVGPKFACYLYSCFGIAQGKMLVFICTLYQSRLP